MEAFSLDQRRPRIAHLKRVTGPPAWAAFGRDAVCEGDGALEVEVCESPPDLGQEYDSLELTLERRRFDGLAHGGLLHAVGTGRGNRSRLVHDAARPCEHPFVTSQGTAHGRFQRAVRRGHVEAAEMAAREMGALSVLDALALVVLYARTGSSKFEPAAVRWIARLAEEGRDVALSDLQLAAAALACLRGLRREKAEKTLLRLL